MSAARILLVDDEPFVLDALGQLLEAEGYEVLRADTLGGAVASLRAESEVDVILSDLKLPDGDALEVLAAARALRPDAPVVVFSGAGTVGHAVAAMKAGALDFLTKPVDPESLLAILRRALEHRGLVEEVRRLRAAVTELPKIVGASRTLREVLALARRAAASDVRVLLRGESGTGKELLAFEIHRASRRAKRPFVRVNCAAIAEGLFESEMFGHRKGSFTGATGDRDGYFAEAHGGTLALDEVGTLPSDAQAKLLRVLESGEYAPVGESRVRRADARVIAITNEDLAARVRQGTFREDLFFRLNVVPIVVPPLRERMDDLPELAGHFLGTIARRDGGPRRRLESGALALLAQHDWPGNVRELRNVLEHAVILTEGEVIRAATVEGILEAGLLVERRETVAPEMPPPIGGEDLRIKSRTEAFQRELIREALRTCGGRRSECARLLGIDPRNLAYYLRKHGLLEGGDAR